MAQYVEDKKIKEQQILPVNMVVESIRMINRCEIKKNENNLEMIISIAYNSLVYKGNLNYQKIESKLRELQENGLLSYENQEIEYKPLTIEETQKIKDENLVFNFNYGYFCRMLFDESELNTEQILEILYYLSYEYRQFIANSDVIIDEIPLLSERAKEKISDETWKNLHMDFDFMYDVISEKSVLYNIIKERYFRALEQLHLIIPMIKVSYEMQKYSV